MKRLFFFLCGISAPVVFALAAPPAVPEGLQVDQVAGQVLYGAGEHGPEAPIHPGMTLGPGHFEAGNNGILYLHAPDGAQLRLSETASLVYLGIRNGVAPTGEKGKEADFELLQGKINIATPPVPTHPLIFELRVRRGEICMSNGTSILCMHGQGTYLYMTRGRAALFGAVGGGHPLWVGANGSIGVLEADGTVRLRPLNAVASGTQNCLLSGLKTDLGGGASSAPNPANTLGNPVVSPTQ